MKVLLLSPHTDDIELAAGGTVVRLLSQGCTIHWMVFSSCSRSVPKSMPEDVLEKEFNAVVDFLNDRLANASPLSHEILDFDVRSFGERRQEILEIFVARRSIIKPDLVIGPATWDLHQDHKTISEEMLRCFKNSCSVLGYDQPWNSNASMATYFTRLEDADLALKWEILQRYRSQIELKRPYFEEETIRAMARVNGLRAGCPYAEAFECIRWMA